MLRLFVKTLTRSFIRNKGNSLINLLGLSVGMACCLLMMFWIADELSYDKYHENSERIYRLCVDANFGAPFVTPLTMPEAGPEIVSQFAEVEQSARLSNPRTEPIKYEDQLIREDDICFGDNSLFEVFSFRLLNGDPQTVLADAYSVVISETMAEMNQSGRF